MNYLIEASLSSSNASKTRPREDENDLSKNITVSFSKTKSIVFDVFNDTSHSTSVSPAYQLSLCLQSTVPLCSSTCWPAWRTSL